MLTTEKFVNRLQQPLLKDSDLSDLERIASSSRVLIIEGISGSGKDTFQTYLKKKLKNRDIYDYSEGEVLHSWKQFQIKGILELRVRFMKLFVNYMKDFISRDDDAVFLLNRFHLSTYAWTVIQQQKLGTEYDDILNVLRMVPVHVFILHLDENEIEQRSLHPERSSAWRKFQTQIVDNYTFCARQEKQQKLIFEAANRQQIPYSVVKLPSYAPEISDQQIRIFKALGRREARMNSVNSTTCRPKRRVSAITMENN
jgi:thymidylate kinase